jgi:hypothetical protein
MPTYIALNSEIAVTKQRRVTTCLWLHLVCWCSKYGSSSKTVAVLHKRVFSSRRKNERWEPLVPEPSSYEVEIAIEKFKRYKSPGIDQILAELIQAGGIHSVLRSTNLLIVFGTRKNCQSSGRNLLLYLFIRRVIKRTVVIIEEYHCYQLHTKSYPAFFCLG